MITFNSNNVVIPSIINSIKVNSLIIDNGYNIPNVTIGKKYYGVFNNQCMAFRVLSISFGKYDGSNSCPLIHNDEFTAYITFSSSIFYELSIADGSHVFYSLSEFIKIPTFYSKEAFFEYVDNNRKPHSIERCWFVNTLICNDIINAFGKNLGIKRNSAHHVDSIYLKGYSTIKGCVHDAIMPLKCLWVDKDGVHYECDDNDSYGKKYFLNDIDAKHSLMSVIDFDDEKPKDIIVNINLSIKESDKEKIMQLLEDYFEE